MSMPDTDPPDASEAIDPWAESAAAPITLSRRERAAVLARIEALMEFWGITVDDLLAPTPEPETPPPPPGPLPVKYRHPVTGDTWDGQGPHPEWLRRALLQEGLRVDELKPAEALPPGSAAG
ncbi:MAG TPA: H-NS histone family protein [Ideonella sp.]|uniref:H-NS histone family protein n=1 Tax=Ideonella sp. TaxID=1929293 RepID=UPI002E2F148E|nr:H-NS histone family protein [Ideonella sp.]HEX5683898.1 H-NS histone family protein [Ideonella sp.]